MLCDVEIQWLYVRKGELLWLLFTAGLCSLSATQCLFYPHYGWFCLNAWFYWWRPGPDQRAVARPIPLRDSRYLWSSALVWANICLPLRACVRLKRWIMIKVGRAWIWSQSQSQVKGESLWVVATRSLPRFSEKTSEKTRLSRAFVFSRYKSWVKPAFFLIRLG